jgi:LAS superfamily LD-carboxypeptidase LdcB
MPKSNFSQMLDKLRSLNHNRYAVWALAFLGVAAVAGGAYFYYSNLKEMSANVASLEETIADLRNDNNLLSQALEAEKAKNASFESQIGELAGTIGRLDQLSRTDKEILQKYSKVYFLNENYVPEDLSQIPTDYVYQKGRTESAHTKVVPFLTEMIEAAKRDGVNLEIISAYRSFKEQASLKSNYTVVYGSGANRFSADQGYSEHQLGTTLDFTTDKLGAGYTAFKSSPGYQWLLDNGYKYGFMLSYPEGNKYYQFEPWHWRFVGKSLAMRLHEEKQNFYDLDQRVINNYLINIFDK